MNKKIDNVDYRIIEGYENRRVTGYKPVQIDEVIQHRSGKTWNVYLKQENTTYYRYNNSLSLDISPDKAIQYIKDNVGLFGLSMFNKLEDLLDKGINDERINLLTWGNYHQTRYAIQNVKPEDLDYLVNKPVLKGHIKYRIHDKPLRENHKPFNHPKLGQVYYESLLVYEYQPDEIYCGNCPDLVEELPYETERHEVTSYTEEELIKQLILTD